MPVTAPKPAPPVTDNVTGAKPAVKPATDWEAIEREYRGGQLSEAEIARQHGVSRTAIQKRAKKRGWSRDLTDRVRTEIAARMVAEGLHEARGAATIELAAARGVAVLTGQRGRIGRATEAVAKLLEELHDTTDHLPDIEDAIHEETAGDHDGKRRSRMLAAVALPSRSSVVHNLTQALKTLIALERQAYNLGDGPSPDDPATKDDIKGLVELLNGDQRDQLRAIAGAIAERPKFNTSGT